MLYSSKNKKITRNQCGEINFGKYVSHITFSISAALSILDTNLQSHAFVTLSRCSAAKVPLRVGTQRLWYRDEEIKQNINSLTKQSTQGSGEKNVFNLFLSREMKEIPREQRNIDEYLEFLDRRYNRLHSDEILPGGTNELTESSGKNSPWNWLFDMNGASSIDNLFSQHVQQSMKDDALYILGVAELASSRLLQKHNLDSLNRRQTNIQMKKQPEARQDDDFTVRNVTDVLVQVKQKQCEASFLLNKFLWVIQRVGAFHDRKAAFVSAMVHTAFRGFSRNALSIVVVPLSVSNNRLIGMLIVAAQFVQNLPHGFQFLKHTKENKI